MLQLKDKWKDGDPYEYFMGRWSALMAPKFLEWLDAPPGSVCLEIGCGTGALSQAIVEGTQPASFYGIDPSDGFIAKARERLQGKGKFTVGNASDLPFDPQTFDLVISGLALNFFPHLDIALAEMIRVAKPGGTIAAYVWDYAGRMDMLRYFWDAAAAIDPQARMLDEGVRFPVCNPENLQLAVQQAGLSGTQVAMLDIITKFNDFNDYWNPFLGGQGPAPGYLAALPESGREALKIRLLRTLPIEPDGSVRLLGRAIAVRGIA